MNRFLQVTNGKVDAVYGNDKGTCPPPEVWPAGRVFVAVPQAHASAPHQLLGGAVTNIVMDPVTGLVASATVTPPPAPPDHGTTVDRREFLLLFTLDQRKAIRAAGATDPDVLDFLELLNAAPKVRLKHPTTVAGLNLLVQKGLIAPADRTRIVNS